MYNLYLKIDIKEYLKNVNHVYDYFKSNPTSNYTINGHNYIMGYYHVDDIYPRWMTFVKTILEAQHNKKKLKKENQNEKQRETKRKTKQRYNNNNKTKENRTRNKKIRKELKKRKKGEGLLPQVVCALMKPRTQRRRSG